MSGPSRAQCGRSGQRPSRFVRHPATRSHGSSSRSYLTSMSDAALRGVSMRLAIAGFISLGGTIII
jgi:hypothetical protein